MIQLEEETGADLWDAPVRQEHRRLKKGALVLDSALSIETSSLSRRVVLSWGLKNLWPELDMHLRKEEEALFPSLERLLGRDSGARAMLHREHEDLRAGFRHLAELVQDPTHLEWDRIELAVEGFLYLLEEHEKLEDRLLLNVLAHRMGKKELAAVSEEFLRVEERVRAEEGWPKPERGYTGNTYGLRTDRIRSQNPSGCGP